MVRGKIAIILATLLVLPFVAAACPVEVQSTNTQDFLTEVTQLNTDLQSCPAAVPSPADRLIGKGNFLLEISMNDNTKKTLIVYTSNKQFTGIEDKTGKARYTVLLSETVVDEILASDTRVKTATKAYVDGKIKIRANTFFQRIAWFFIQPFVKKAAAKTT